MSTESGHYYDLNGNPRHTVPNKSKPGEMRPTKITDARKLKLFPSVSAYVKQKNEEGLARWKMGQVIETCYGWYGPKDCPKRYAADIQKAAFEQVDDAARYGDMVHADVNASLSGKPLQYRDKVVRLNGQNISVYTGVKLVMEKIEERNIHVTKSELVLVNAKHGYAGTTDGKYHKEDPTLGILDIKTKRTRVGEDIKQIDSHPMQVAAYWQAAYSREWGEDIPANAEGINIYVSTTEPGRIEVVEYDDIALRKAWGAFKACLELYRYSTGYDARVL